MSQRFPTVVSNVLFDLDGTLVDTAADFAAVLDIMTDAAVRPQVAIEAVHRTVSSGARALVELAFEIDNAHPDFKALFENLLALYGEQIENTRSSLYPGIAELLSLLEKHGIKWGVVTNKPERFSIPLLRKLGLLERCQTLICPDHVTYPKPHPEPLLLACTQLSCLPETGIYVGDHPRDITAGQEAGMFTIAAAYGYLPVTPPVASWGADIVVTAAEQITQLLTTNLKI